MSKQKYYAVHNGRGGTQIYLTWDETKANVLRIPGVMYKSFRTLVEAQAWLQGIADATAVDAPPPYQYHAAHDLADPMPPAGQGAPGPSTVQAVQRRDSRERPYADHYMDVDNEIECPLTPPPSRALSAPQQSHEYDSDIEILPGPPDSARVTPAYKYDDEIEILPGPPPGARARRWQSQAPPQAIAAGVPQPVVPTPVIPKREPGVADKSAAHLTKSEGIPVADPDPPIELSPDQSYVLAKVQRGESVFFTGSAGTGKSVLLREIIKACGGRPSLELGVTASTGIASVNIGGCTLHSWAGIGLGKEDREVLVAKIYGMSLKVYKTDQKRKEELLRKKAMGVVLDAEELAFLRGLEKRRSASLDRWRRAKTLIVDEISMIDGKLFDKLEYVGRKLRGNERPFGGIQLVLSGDFCQLPPVPDKSANGGQIPACFAFDSESWPRCVGAPVILRKVFRQRDQTFVDMLNAMRFGQLDAQTTVAFKALSRQVHYDDGIEPTELYPTRAEVDSANSSRLAKLNGNPRVYKAVDVPGRDKDGNDLPRSRVERALKDVVAPESLPLKVGAQVMLVKNIIQGVLVNGSVGRVVGFYKPRDAVSMGAMIAHPELAREDRPDGFSYKNVIPKVPAEQREENLRKILAHGSEPSKPNSEPEPGPEPLRVENGPDDISRREMRTAQAEQREHLLRIILALPTVWPTVQFQGGQLMLCISLSFEVNNAEGKIEAVRDQVPLILAWALSIHKSQGQTLERVRVNLSRIFEKGQAYVALSRATRMETLEVLNFDPSKVRAHPRVLQWMAEHAPRAIEPRYTGPDDVDVDEALEYWQDLL